MQFVYCFWDNYWEAICWANIYLPVSKKKSKYTFFTVWKHSFFYLNLCQWDETVERTGKLSLLQPWGWSEPGGQQCTFSRLLFGCVGTKAESELKRREDASLPAWRSSCDILCHLRWLKSLVACVRWGLIWLQAADADINQVSALTDYLCGGLGQRDKTGTRGGCEHKPIIVNLTTTSEPVVCVLHLLHAWNKLLHIGPLSAVYIDGWQQVTVFKESLSLWIK